MSNEHFDVFVLRKGCQMRLLYVVMVALLSGGCSVFEPIEENKDFKSVTRATAKLIDDVNQVKERINAIDNRQSSIEHSLALTNDQIRKMTPLMDGLEVINPEAEIYYVDNDDSVYKTTEIKADSLKSGDRVVVFSKNASIRFLPHANSKIKDIIGYGKQIIVNEVKNDFIRVLDGEKKGWSHISNFRMVSEKKYD